MDRKPPSEPLNRRLVETESVMRLTGRSRRSLANDVALGRMPAPVKIGRSVRWRLEELEAWIDGGCKPVRPHDDEPFKPTIPPPAPRESHPGNPSPPPRQSIQFTPAECHPNNHTNHQKHQSNGTGAEASSAVDGWMAKPPSEEPVDQKAEIRRVLRQCGVSGPNLDLLANAKGITPEAIASEFADSRSNAMVRKASAVLVARLALDFNVTLKRGLAVSDQTLKAISKIEAMRRRSSGFFDSEDRRTLQ